MLTPFLHTLSIDRFYYSRFLDLMCFIRFTPIFYTRKPLLPHPLSLILEKLFSMTCYGILVIFFTLFDRVSNHRIGCVLVAGFFGGNQYDVSCQFSLDAHIEINTLKNFLFS